MTDDFNHLTPAQIQTFLSDGVLVVPLLTPDELFEAQSGLIETLREEYGVDAHDLERTGRGLMDASSTNGAGGVLDIFYPKWKMKIATNEKLFQITSQLWKEAYFHAGESLNDEVSGPGQKEDDSFKWHPYGAFDCNKGYMYIDRIGFRLPTNLAEQIGKQVANEQLKEASLQSAKKFRPRPIQRSLTPHFDCCPETFYDANKNKWRPIQCFVSLTDNSQPNTGGFEAAPGFHREFSTWTKNGRRYVDTGDRQPHPRPCVGEYTHINPTHDREILDRVQHIPVKAGYAVFWDNRIPHGNAYRNDPIESDVDMSSKIQADKPSIMLKRSGARAVVYCSFLPDVELNRSFIRSQLLDFKLGRAPRAGDRWIKQDDNEMISDDKAAFAQLTELGCKLLGIHEW